MHTSLDRLLILPRILLTLSVRHTTSSCPVSCLSCFCLQTPSLFSRAAPQPEFLSFLVERRKVILSSLVAFVLAKFSVKSSCWSSPPACWDDRPALRHSDWSFPHFGVLCKAYNQALGNLFQIADRCDQRQDSILRYPTYCHLPGSVWPINHLNGNKVDLAEDRNNNSTVMILYAITF